STAATLLKDGRTSGMRSGAGETAAGCSAFAVVASAGALFGVAVAVCPHLLTTSVGGSFSSEQLTDLRFEESACSGVVLDGAAGWHGLQSLAGCDSADSAIERRTRDKKERSAPVIGLVGLAAASVGAGGWTSPERSPACCTAGLASSATHWQGNPAGRGST